MPLVAMLQSIVRPIDIDMTHFQALGVQVIPNSEVADLLPDPSLIPEFAAWSKLDSDEVHATNESTRKPLNNGNLSPGCQVYLDRKRELSIANSDAFRTVRRVPPPKGKSQARLGNSFEFYRHLDLVSSFWDDTSKPRPSVTRKENSTGIANGDSNGTSLANSEAPDVPEEYKYYRASTGNQMPAEYRQNLATAFLKLVAYDYGCNVSASRMEPRLYLTNNPPPVPPVTPSTQPSPSSTRRSYFSSSCTFVFRTPTTREAARAGVVEGPLAAVSVRHTTTFPPTRRAPSAPTSSTAGASSSAPAASDPLTAAPAPLDKDSAIDLARELIAALVTAQHRAREGRKEKRFGEGEWWTTKPRWGGRPGGPIGREVDMQSGLDGAVGDKDAPLPSVNDTVQTPAKDPGSRRSSSRLLSSSPSGFNGGSSKSSKRLKKSGNLPMYDNYRMVRPPSAAWDPKARYSAIGRTSGTDYDDIFVVSCLFHHVSVLRVRVPDRLLAVLEGADDDDLTARTWGKLELRRSRWFDLFKIDERVAAMELVWSMMSYLMRGQGGSKEGVDAQMADA